MKDALDRLLRLRTLLEGVSRLELEMRLQELAQIEAGLTYLAENKKASRSQSFAGFMQADNSLWLEAEAAVELTAWQQEMLANGHAQKAVEVDAAKSAYLTRRKESRQVESVVEARAAEKAIERNRREQRALDDWFNQRKR